MKFLLLEEASNRELGKWKRWGGGEGRGGGVSKFKERPKGIFPRADLEFKREGGWAPKDIM